MKRTMLKYRQADFLINSDPLAKLQIVRITKYVVLLHKEVSSHFGDYLLKIHHYCVKFTLFLHFDLKQIMKMQFLSLVRYSFR